MNPLTKPFNGIFGELKSNVRGPTYNPHAHLNYIQSHFLQNTPERPRPRRQHCGSGAVTERATRPALRCQTPKFAGNQPRRRRAGAPVRRAGTKGREGVAPGPSGGSRRGRRSHSCSAAPRQRLLTPLAEARAGSTARRRLGRPARVAALKAPAARAGRSAARREPPSAPGSQAGRAPRTGGLRLIIQKWRMRPLIH